MTQINRATRRRRSGQKGFTLIELLVVIAVLGVLAAIVLFNVAGVKNKGSTAACNTDGKSVQVAVDAYLNDGSISGALVAGDMTPAEIGYLVPTYIHTTPTSCTKFTLAGTAASGFTVTPTP